jgi:hypothetical protein
MCKTLRELLLKNNETIDIRECYQQTGIEDILETLNQELVGLQTVKNK